MSSLAAEVPVPVTARAIDDPGDLLALLPSPAALAWVRDREGIVGWGSTVRVDLGTGPQRFAVAARSAGRLLASPDGGSPGPVAFCSLTFDEHTPGSVLLVPRVQVRRKDGEAWLITVGDDPDEPSMLPGIAHAAPAPGRIRYAGADLEELRWLETVAAASTAVADGALDKVVLARDVRVWSQEALDARALTRRLAEEFPDCFTFSVAGLVGASPELLVRRTGDRVQSVVLAGSAARGDTPDADAALGRALLSSAKDLAEHRPAVASVVEHLSEICADVRVEPEPCLLRLANIQHLATAVSGQLDAPAHVLDIAAALHPTAAVCGTPREEALAWIRAHEGLDRGRYAGPVGWVDGAGDGELAIALRCAEVDGSRARLFAGAGIVGASRPEAELEETRLKLRAMQSAFEH